MSGFYHVPQEKATIFFGLSRFFFALQVIFEKLFTVGVTLSSQNCPHMENSVKTFLSPTSFSCHRRSGHRHRLLPLFTTV
jgi:hypothetical protein